MQLESFLRPLMISWVVATMLVMGMGVTLAQIRDAARDLGLLARSILANILLIPLVVWTLCYAFRLPPEITIGLLISAAAPGAPVSPLLCDKARGHVPFALGLLIICSLLCVVATPWVCRIVLPVEGDLQLDVIATIQTVLVVQLVPLCIGLVIRYRRADWAHLLARIIDVIGNVLLVLMLAAFAIVKLQTLGGISATAILVMAIAQTIALWLGYQLGGPEREKRIALSISTNLRNVPIALLIAASNFPDTKAAPTVIAYFIVSAIGSIALTIHWAQRGASEARNRS